MTRDEGRSVMTFPEFMLDPLANLLQDTGRPRLLLLECMSLELVRQIFSPITSFSTG